MADDGQFRCVRCGGHWRKQTYVRYYTPGLFISEEQVLPVDERNPLIVAGLAPPEVYAFEFFDQVFCSIEVDGVLTELRSDEIALGKRFLIDAEILSEGKARTRAGNIVALDDRTAFVSKPV
jgi:hypothetical protein